MKRELNKICKELNAILPVRCQEDINKLNDIITGAFDKYSWFDLYYDRDIFIDCNGDHDKMAQLVTKTDDVRFYVNDDLEEHPGIVVKYKIPDFDESKFLELNSTLIKFWKENNITNHRDRIAYLERMVNWYKKAGNVTLD